MSVMAKSLIVLASIAVFASCGKQGNFSTATGKILFPYKPVSLSRISLTKIEPDKIKLKNAEGIAVYTYSIKLSPSYTARGYLFEGPEETRKAKGNAFLRSLAWGNFGRRRERMGVLQRGGLIRARRERLRHPGRAAPLDGVEHGYGG
jgi:hypothetical protein